MTTPMNPQPTESQSTTAKSFWSTPGGVILALALAGMVVAAGYVAMWSLRQEPKVDVTLTSCDVDSGHALSNVKIGYRLTNTGSREKTFFLRFEVTDGSGTRVGDDTEIVSDVAPGATVQGEAFVRLDAFGSHCKLVSVR